jgi:hypothetical protein
VRESPNRAQIHDQPTSNAQVQSAHPTDRRPTTDRDRATVAPEVTGGSFVTVASKNQACTPKAFMPALTVVLVMTGLTSGARLFLLPAHTP